MEYREQVSWKWFFERIYTSWVTIIVFVVIIILGWIYSGISSNDFLARHPTFPREGWLITLLTAFKLILPIPVFFLPKMLKKKGVGLFEKVDKERLANDSINSFVRKVRRIFRKSFFRNREVDTKTAARKLCNYLKRYVVDDIRKAVADAGDKNEQIIRAVSNYNFIYIISRFTETYLGPTENPFAAFKKLLETCKLIVEEYVGGENDHSDHDKRATAFAALYLYSYICKKCLKWKETIVASVAGNDASQKEIDEAIKSMKNFFEQAVSTAAQNAFARFPIYSEVSARFIKRLWPYDGKDKSKGEENFLQALQADANAISLIEEKGYPLNCAVFASYVSVLCDVLESQKETSLKLEDNHSTIIQRRKEISLAKHYIDACTKNYPKYPKYAYLRAKLLYLEVTCLPWTGTTQERIIQLHDAMSWCENAKKRLLPYLGLSSSYEDDQNKYGRFLKEVTSFMNSQLSMLNVPRMKVASFAKTEKSDNQEAKRPNEDCYKRDDNNGIYIVVDGVTRPASEYGEQDEFGVYTSSAKRLSHKLCKRIHANLVENAEKLSGLERIKEAVAKIYDEPDIFEKRANGDKAANLPDDYFDPSAVGIIATVENNKLYYLSMGDCAGEKLRRRERVVERIYFGRQNSVEANNRKKLTKREKFEQACNKRDAQYRYAIFNGDKAAMDLAEVGEVPLSPGDVIFLYSDGIDPYFRYANGEDILKKNDDNENIDTLFEDSKRYLGDCFKSTPDDKTAIMIKCIEK